MRRHSALDELVDLVAHHLAMRAFGRDEPLNATKGELELMLYLGQGKTNAWIADKLNTSPNNIANRIFSMTKRTGYSRGELGVYGLCLNRLNEDRSEEEVA